MNAHAREVPGTGEIVSPRRLFVGLAAGPAAWALHGLVSSALAGWACSDGDLALGLLTSGGTRLLLGAITLVAMGITAAGGLAAWSSWRALRDSSGAADERTHARASFMAAAGLMVTALALLGLVYAVVPIIIEDVCGKVR